MEPVTPPSRLERLADALLAHLAPALASRRRLGLLALALGGGMALSFVGLGPFGLILSFGCGVAAARAA
jgi:hypothetical protein